MQVDQAQDMRLGNLEAENNQLKLYLASLARLFVAKGVLSEAELRSFIGDIDEDESS
jgi:hypothetical protein